MDLQVLNKNKYLLLGSVFLLTSCSSSKLPVEGKSAETVYKEAENFLEREEFEDAANRFKDIETYFPYSEKSSTSQIMAAYCYFKDGKYEDAVRELEVFLRYHPANKLVPYALYLKAVSKYMRVSTIGRDSNPAKEARSAFIELVNRFPTCKYADDGRTKIIILDDIVAAHEMLIGRYYQNMKSSVAAINRYNYVVSMFPHTKCVEEALFRLVECCKNEGLNEEAEDFAKALKERFPNGNWTKKLSVNP